MTEITSPTGPERPIQDQADDKLERSRFIERLAAAVVNPATAKSTGVVVGITGPWGSGKSSILNLLYQRLSNQYQDALVVRFDPWLVSGSHDLIGEFLGELIGTIKSNEKRLQKFRRLSVSIAEYGAQLSSLGNAWIPGIGLFFSAGLQATQKALSKKESLSALRSRIMKELREASSPIVVLIDELDRIDDEEIRSVAQLVRSVLDFPGISFVLAFDPERVIQALGNSGDESQRRERGRSYLEKIVQLQIPIPIIFQNEIARLLTADLQALKNELKLPESFENTDRFKELAELLTADVIQTPRDVRRLVGTFHVLAGMLFGEVNWVDLLAYSALLIKAPATVAKMRAEPDEFLGEPRSARAITKMISDGKVSPSEKLKALVPNHELNFVTEDLLKFLLPSFSDEGEIGAKYEDAFRERRPFLTTLRLGLIPGAYSREDTLALFHSDSEQVKSSIKRAYEDGSLDALTDRVDDLFSQLSSSRQIDFWKGVAGFAAKPDCDWLSSYSPMHEKIRNFVGILEHAVRRDATYRDIAIKVFSNLKGAGDNELIAYWLRSHIFEYGLFDNRSSGRARGFLSREQTEAMARELTAIWRSEHLSGKLLPCRWDLQCVYTMVDMGVWDAPCVQSLDESLKKDAALDGFALLLFGAHYSTGDETISKMCSLNELRRRAQARLESKPTLHQSVEDALKRVLGRHVD